MATLEEQKYSTEYTGARLAAAYFSNGAEGLMPIPGSQV
jgi:hypothetical protein